MCAPDRVKRAVIANIELRPTGYKILLEVLSRGVYARAVEIAYTFQEPKAIRQRALGQPAYHLPPEADLATLFWLRFMPIAIGNYHDIIPCTLN